MTADIRLTQYASGGGWVCKIPPEEVEYAVAALRPGRAIIVRAGATRVGLAMLAVGDGLTLARAR